MTMMTRYPAIAAGLIGGAMLAMGTVPASATSLAPAVMHTGSNVNVEEVQYRPGYGYAQPWHHGRYAPQYGGLGFHFGLTPYGPTAGFGLGVPHGPTVGYGLGVPRDHRGFALGVPVGQRHAWGAPAIDPHVGRIDR